MTFGFSIRRVRTRPGGVRPAIISGVSHVGVLDSTRSVPIALLVFAHTRPWQRSLTASPRVMGNRTVAASSLVRISFLLGSAISYLRR